jgi:hypothetical protein
VNFLLNGRKDRIGAALGLLRSIVADNYSGSGRRSEEVGGVRAVEQRDGPLMIEFGRVVKKLPPEYSGPRRLVPLGRLLDGTYQWEGQPGP